MTTRIASLRNSKTRSTRRTLLVAGATVFVLGTGAGVTGQQRPQDLRAPQTASVDFMVVSKDGQPVTDMKSDELTLRVDGKVRPIRSLTFIRLSSPIGNNPAGTPPVVDPAFATNLATAAELPRSIILIVDDETMPIGQEQKIRTALNNFIRDLPATDQVALVTVPHGGIKVGLTTDRERLRKEIAAISPISPMQDMACRTVTTLSTIESTLDMLTRASTQPVTVALLSSQLAGASTAEMAPRPVAGGGSLSSQAGGCNIKTDDFVRIGQAVAAVRAQFYVIHPDYTQGAASDGIGNLQGQTNAPLFHLMTNSEPGLSRMARETSGYYVATFDTEPDELVGKPHQSSVKTTRRDVDVRDRPFLVVGRPSATANTVTPTTVTTAMDMVRTGKQYRDLSLRATTSSFRNADGSVNVVAVFEPTDPSVKVMTAYAALIDEDNLAKAVWQGEVDKLTSWPTTLGLTVKPGKYRFRIAAIDSNGRQGLIDDQVVAELRPAGALQISGLLLGLQPAGKPFTTRMHFTTEPEAIAYLELYGATEGTKVAAFFEVSTTTNGAAMSTVPGSFASTGEDGKYAVTAKIPLASLAAGDYVVRAIVGEPGKPGARVIRTLHKAR
jgi:hypothetical protein